MRVSNLHHETAVESLYYLEEIEKDTWDKLTKRLSGINTAGKLGRDNFLKIKELPFMFRDWVEYRDHLLENLVTNEKHKAKFRKKFDKMDVKYDMEFNKDNLTKVQINSILANDFEFTKLSNWERHPDVDTWRKWKRGITNKYTHVNKYING
jgi:predicted phosphoadenosine phosphosulfate sulfurtransferase